MAIKNNEKFGKHVCPQCGRAMILTQFYWGILYIPAIIKLNLLTTVRCRICGTHLVNYLALSLTVIVLSPFIYLALISSFDYFPSSDFLAFIAVGIPIIALFVHVNYFFFYRIGRVRRVTSL